MAKEVISELHPLVKVYSDGTVERLIGSPFVQPTPEDVATGVSSKDIALSPNVSARLYLPKLSSDQKLPILVYFHGGAFCLESAFSFLHHRYLNRLVAQSGVLAVSVEFRQAPEHPLPIAYEDAWTSLRWIASHLLGGDDVGFDREPWLSDYGDFERLYVGGDATGANIAHNTALRAGSESLAAGELKILGAVLCLPVFWGSTPVGSEAVQGHLEHMLCRVWAFVYPSAPGGIDNPRMNPFGAGSRNLGGLGCSRVLVCVGEKDGCRERGICYFEAVKESGWEGEVELYVAEGCGHGFNISDPQSHMSKKMIQKLATFMAQ